MKLHDEYTIDCLVQLTDDRMQEIPIKRRAEWLQEWAQVLHENFQVNLLVEMKKRGFQ